MATLDELTGLYNRRYFMEAWNVNGHGLNGMAKTFPSV
jgi:hypothetical protein